MLKFYLTKACQ